MCFFSLHFRFGKLVFDKFSIWIHCIRYLGRISIGHLDGIQEKYTPNTIFMLEIWAGKVWTRVFFLEVCIWFSANDVTRIQNLIIFSKNNEQIVFSPMLPDKQLTLPRKYYFIYFVYVQVFFIFFVYFWWSVFLKVEWVFIFNIFFSLKINTYSRFLMRASVLLYIYQAK